MDFETFVCRVQAKLKEKTGEGTHVERRRITKNNGIELEGVMITDGSRKISPMIYLEDYYHAYEKGVGMEEILEDILQVHRESLERIPLDSAFFMDFKKVSPRIAGKLVNYEKNREQLQKIPHQRCLDLALVFYYIMDSGEMCSGTILIHNSHLEMWGVSQTELFETARRNTPRLLPSQFMSIQDFMTENFEDMEQAAQIEKGLPMYVLSNRERHFGAVHILYDQVLSSIGRELGENFYILPSSVHECIIVPAGVCVVKEQLARMVWEINRMHVLPEEVLSDHVYYYDREKHRLSL